MLSLITAKVHYTPHSYWVQGPCSAATKHGEIFCKAAQQAAQNDVVISFISIERGVVQPAYADE